MLHFSVQVYVWTNSNLIFSCQSYKLKLFFNASDIRCTISLNNEPYVVFINHSSHIKKKKITQTAFIYRLSMKWVQNYYLGKPEHMRFAMSLSCLTGSSVSFVAAFVVVVVLIFYITQV